MITGVILLVLLIALLLVERREHRAVVARLTEVHQKQIAEVEADAAADRRRADEAVANAESESITAHKKRIEHLESFIEAVERLRTTPTLPGSYLDRSYLDGDVDEEAVQAALDQLKRERAAHDREWQTWLSVRSR